MPLGLLLVFPASFFSFLHYFLILSFLNFSVDARWKVTVEAGHPRLFFRHPLPFFHCFYPTTISPPKCLLRHPPVSNSVKSPCTINSHYQPAHFYGQGAFLLRPPSGLRSHSYKFTLEPLILCWFATSSGLPLSCTFPLLFCCWHMHLDPNNPAHMQDAKSSPAVINSK